MRTYDPSEPLIFIHVPKCAGTSVRRIFKTWYGARLLLDYPGHTEKPDIIHHQAPVIYGHFNTEERAVRELYPDVAQFVTILRDPFERAVSIYFYNKARGRLPQCGLAEFLSAAPAAALHHFPRVITEDNFREMIEEMFVEVGVVEHLEESLRRIAEKLMVPFDPSWLKVTNVSERNEAVPYHLRDSFRAKRPLLYSMYEYALSRYAR